jgi:phosphatidylglycerophosphate synthase
MSDGGGRAVLFLAAAGCIELRLLCNMLDGMVAIEGGLQTRSGAVFNELPDRLGDAATLVLAGYSLGGPDWASGLGWAAALTAVLTAYVRALGGSLGLAQDFGGPMAKPHRMQLMAAAAVVAAVGSIVGPVGTSRIVIAAALILVILGSAVTVARRTIGIIRDLESASGGPGPGPSTGSG